MYRKGELTGPSQLGIVCTPICLVISAYAEETLPRYANWQRGQPPHAWTLLHEDLAKVPQHGAKSSRARMPWRVQTRNRHTAQGCRRREAPPTKNCQVRYTGSCACIAELCTEKASSPEHRSLALCAHRSAWSSPLSPRRPCHGMHTLSARPAPPCMDLVVRGPRQGTNTGLFVFGKFCLCNVFEEFLKVKVIGL